MLVPFISSSSAGRRHIKSRSNDDYYVQVAGQNVKAWVNGTGSFVVVTIPAGQQFAGRSMGGGTRSSVYGTKCALRLHPLQR